MRKRNQGPIGPDGKTRSSGMWWMGSMYPLPKEIADGIKHAKQKGWPIRIHLEPPDYVAFYVLLPVGVTPPDAWLQTMDPDTLNPAHRDGY